MNRYCCPVPPDCERPSPLPMHLKAACSWRGSMCPRACQRLGRSSPVDVFVPRTAKGSLGASGEGRGDMGNRSLSGQRSSTAARPEDATPKHQRARRQQQQQQTQQQQQQQQQQQFQGPQPRQPRPNVQARMSPSQMREGGFGATNPTRRSPGERTHTDKSGVQSPDGSGAGIWDQPRGAGADPSAKPGRGSGKAGPRAAAAAASTSGSQRTLNPDRGGNPGSYGSEDFNGDGAEDTFPGTRDGVNERRHRMIREAIEEALRTDDGKLTGEAVVRTPYKPGGGGGKVAGKVTFLVSPIEVAQTLLDQAQRDAEELSRRTVHPALKEAQGRRFQSMDPLGLGSDFGRESRAGGGSSSSS
ncbi:hypothetical protein Vretimale_6611, partial [Volvox reticuliferus]